MRGSALVLIDSRHIQSIIRLLNNSISGAQMHHREHSLERVPLRAKEQCRHVSRDESHTKLKKRDNLISRG